MATVYEAAGGIGGLLRLANAWHARVMADEEVSHAFSHGYRPDHSERLAAYWAEVLGGPPVYSEQCADESFVLHLHSGNGDMTDLGLVLVHQTELILGDQTSREFMERVLAGLRAL